MKWNQSESEHYVFYFHPNSLAEKEIHEIMDIQERCFQYLTHVLKVELEEKIHYYLCESEDEVGVHSGTFLPCSGFTKEPNEIYVVYNRKKKWIGFHEDSHLIANRIACPRSVALREGLAMFFDKKWCGIHNFEWVLYLLESDTYVSLQKLMKENLFYDYPSYMTYPVMGAFTQYLILTYGLDKYLKLYKMREQTLNKSFKDVYDCSIKTMENEFLGYVGLFKLDYAIRDRLVEQLY